MSSLFFSRSEIASPTLLYDNKLINPFLGSDSIIPSENIQKIPTTTNARRYNWKKSNVFYQAQS